MERIASTCPAAFWSVSRLSSSAMHLQKSTLRPPPLQPFLPRFFVQVVVTLSRHTDCSQGPRGRSAPFVLKIF